MFNQAIIFNNDISSWDVSLVTNMQGLFRLAHAFDSDISGWDVSSATKMNVSCYSSQYFYYNVKHYYQIFSNYI